MAIFLTGSNERALRREPTLMQGFDDESAMQGEGEGERSRADARRRFRSHDRAQYHNKRRCKMSRKKHFQKAATGEVYDTGHIIANSIITPV